MGAVGAKKKRNTENLGAEAPIIASDHYSKEGLFSYKILLVGNEGVGKASLFQSFHYDSRSSFSSPKTGFTVIWGGFTVSLKKKKINLRISYTGFCQFLSLLIFFLINTKVYISFLNVNNI